MQIPNQYNPNQVEDKWYAYWMEQGYFHSTPNDKKPYTIVIPPPNVTGVLHMGHMLNNTIQDVLIRKARLQGFNACWVPGTDHASIATEAKVVEKLKEEGIAKSDLTREEFLKHAWSWTHKHGGLILEQLKKLGASCDWERTKFTMDKSLSDSVIKVFVDLHKKGLIYRGYRMVNWDPEAKTTLSDEEVEYVEKEGKLYYFNYPVENSTEVVTIATTRPETMLGDTAICIHPEDERFVHLKGKNVIVPIANRVVPIIEDTYVDKEFGTGCLKITPAHDPNDKIIGEQHNLEFIDIFNDNGTLNAQGLHYEGKNRFVARKEIVKELQALGCFVKHESYIHKVGISERTKAVIEPKISAQWFLKMETLVKPALKAVLEDEEIKLFPKHYNNTYRHWLENIKDWNISRQLWWGHQIPAYFYGDGEHDYVIAETEEEALKLAKTKANNQQLTVGNLKRDPDTLDTWFSAWLWPISVFDGINHPENKEYQYYYPTNDLVTGPDIIFFWVARMIFSGYEYSHQKPFNNVYFTGIVRDKKRRKMSKQLGNSPDPITLIKKFGADGVRVGLLLSAPAGNDLLFDEQLCEQGRNFSNKIWNAFRLVKGWEVATDIKQHQASKQAIQWYEAKFQQTLSSIEKSFESYRISEALMSIYKLVWDDFASWFLEIVKPGYQQPIDQETYTKTIAFFEDNLRLLHPFMPFLTEEIWQLFADRKPEEALIVNTYPIAKETNISIIQKFEYAAEVVSEIRTVRKQNQLPFKEAVALCVLAKNDYDTGLNAVIQKLGNVSEIQVTLTALENAKSFRVGAHEYYIPVAKPIDGEDEKSKVLEELNYTQGFLKSVQKKLSNERFVSNAPENVIANERKKEADALAKIEMLKQRIM